MKKILVNTAMLPIAISLALGGCKNQTQQAAPNAAPPVVQAARPTVVKSPVAESAQVTPEVHQPQPEVDQPLDDETIKTERALQHFLSLPDPRPPVATDKIKGVWWSEDDNEQNKVFAFVEELNLFAKPKRALLSTPNGTKLVVECLLAHPPRKHSLRDSTFDCGLLPLFTWTRMAATDVIVNPEADQWGITYRADDRASVSAYLVKSICYPNGNCTTFEEAGRRAVEKDRDKSRRGEY